MGGISDIDTRRVTITKLNDRPRDTVNRIPIMRPLDASMESFCPSRFCPVARLPRKTCCAVSFFVTVPMHLPPPRIYASAADLVPEFNAGGAMTQIVYRPFGFRAISESAGVVVNAENNDSSIARIPSFRRS